MLVYTNVVFDEGLNRQITNAYCGSVLEQNYFRRSTLNTNNLVTCLCVYQIIMFAETLRVYAKFINLKI